MGPLLVGLLHVALVAPHYHVGSFDDDAGYILSARALLHGQALTAQLPTGDTIAGLYPPGYSALLVPLLWVWPHSFLPLRLLSVACYAAVFPLTWAYLRRHHVGAAVRGATLLLLALSPPLATYGSMVMAECPFLVVLLGLLLCFDKWRDDPRLVGPYGAATALLAAALVWLKQAGIGLVGGLVLWMLLSRMPRGRRRALVVAAVVAAALAPVALARHAAGVPLAGGRYSLELGAYYSGGLAGRLTSVLPNSAYQLLSTALPATLVPYLAPLPTAGSWADIGKVLSWPVTILAAIGAVAWWRGRRRVALVMVGLYLLESVLWPFVNERRAILVVPLLAAWYAVGAQRLWSFAAARWRIRATVPALVACAVVLVPLVAQMPRDYLFGWNENSSDIGGSRYAALLGRLGPPSAVVETDYRSAVALFTGHQTNWTAFTSTQIACYLPVVLTSLRSDAAATLLLGDVNKPHVVDSPCLLLLARHADWAVPLMHSRRDNASVYELIGPFTGHPETADLLDGSVETQAAGHTTWTFPGPRVVSQVSLGEAGPGPVRVEVLTAGGWRSVASSPGPVGDGGTPFLLASFARGPTVRAVRVDTGSAPTPAIRDLAVLGPA